MVIEFAIDDYNSIIHYRNPSIESTIFDLIRMRKFYQAKMPRTLREFDSYTLRQRLQIPVETTARACGRRRRSPANKSEGFVICVSLELCSRRYFSGGHGASYWRSCSPTAGRLHKVGSGFYPSRFTSNPNLSFGLARSPHARGCARS
jgi:hypothetical protein